MLNIGNLYLLSNRTNVLCASSSCITVVQFNLSTTVRFPKELYGFLLIRQQLNGYGGTCLLSVGVTYLDQNVPSKIAGKNVNIHLPQKVPHLQGKRWVVSTLGVLLKTMFHAHYHSTTP